jgi:DNA-binding NarL/FixJ family response regulator
MYTLSTLVLDDHRPFRKTLRRLLSRFEYIQISAEADSAEEALESVEHDPPELAIIDIRLPGMDGFEFSRILKSKSPQTRIIFVTLHDNEAYQREAERLGIPYVTKHTLLERLPPVLEKLGREGGSG